MKVYWTDEAKASYSTTIKNILDKWGVDTAIKLEDDVNALIHHLEQYKLFCPASKKDKKLRKCVISKQTSLFYEVNKTHIDLILFIDNRTNHNY